MNPTDEYSEFVAHPRFGRTPRFTRVRPGQALPGYSLAPHHARGIIEGTAVAADLGRQCPSTIPALYYFDLKRACLDCGRPFIFFAEEQKHWYETLGFVLDADCVRCADCRRKQHRLDRWQRRFEELFHHAERSVDEQLEMAEISLDLIQAGVFHPRQLERVRMLLNRIPEEESKRIKQRCEDIRQRLKMIES